MTLKDVLALLQGNPRPLFGTGWNPDVQTSGVRPDYGLTGALIGSQAQSPHERTLAPGQTRTADDLQSMLAEVILAGGAGASPLTGLTGRQLARARIGRARASQAVPTPSAKPKESDEGMVLYHGTNREFDRFDTQKAGSQAGAIGDWAGSYFTPDKSQAEGIARWSAKMGGGTPVVKKVRVQLQNPAEFGQFKTREDAEAAGFDGRVFRDVDGKITEVLAFHPHQIKILD